MVSEESIEEIHVDDGSVPTPKLSKFRQFKLRIPSIRAELLNQGSPTSKTPRILDFLKARPSRDWFRKIRLSSPLAIFRRTVNRKEEISLSVPSPAGIRHRFHIQFFRKINWSSILNMCKEWLSHPLNIALLIWLLALLVVAIFLGLLLLGVLNHAIPSKQERSNWIEICNQVINALFTLMSLYQHPIVLHHLFMLCRWNSDDIMALRKIYCKNAAYRPHEWAHMMVVAVLIQICFFAQYALCAVYWLYPRDKRPEYLEDLFGGIGLLTPVVAGVYALYCPLGREVNLDSNEESQDANESSKNRLNFDEQRVVVSEPQWVGGLFDCRDDMTVSRLSFFCTCCVFGWNMERLGFGNMYVHIVTFILLCFAPFWIFSTTALKIHNVTVDNVMWALGIVLCVLGLLYGGFWRTQMRKKFKLPGNPFCCGSALLTDYFQWMFCWSCSLAQEVRTGNFYDIEDDSLYRKLLDSDEESQISSENGSSPVNGSNSESMLPSSTIADDFSKFDSLVDLIPPAQPLMQSDGRENGSKTYAAQHSLQMIQ